LGVAVIENKVEIARPIEEVFDFVSDMRNELKWNPDVESMEKITEGPVGLGTRFNAKWHTSPQLMTERTNFHRPTSFSYHNGGPIEVDLTITLNSTPEGTLLTSCFDARPHGFFRLIFPIFLIILRRQEKANMVNVKRVLETQPAVLTERRQ
jgi:hypothetical protein